MFFIFIIDLDLNADIKVSKKDYFSHYQNFIYFYFILFIEEFRFYFIAAGFLKFIIFGFLNLINSDHFIRKS